MYLLMHGETTVMRFNYEGFEEVVDEKWLPEEVQHVSLAGFLYDRATKFRARETYQALLVTLGIDDYKKTREVLDRTYGLSLTDLYWIKKEDDPMTFKDISFYTHPLDDITAQAGYLGQATKLGGLSPEYTIDGQLPKCIIRRDDQLFLLKRGSTWGDMPGREMYDEYYASQLLDALAIDHVPYELISYQGYLASSCPFMTNLNESYVPIACFDYHDEKAIFRDFVNRGFGREIRTMILFDALVYNYDRHIGNFGYLKNNQNGRYRFAPLFDHGNAFFPLATEKERNDLMSYRHQVDISAVGVAFDDLIRDYLTDAEMQLLDRLDGFEIMPHPHYPEDVSIYNAFLKKRICEMKEIYQNK